MGIAAALAVFVVGLVVGLVSGLIGIGGGVLIVPFLYFFYARPELFGVVAAPELHTVVAHGTSLFVIVPTSLRGAFAYHRAGLVRWKAVWPIGMGSAIFAVIGAQLAPLIEPAMLKAAFGLLLVVSGLRLWRRGPDRREEGAELPPRLTLPITLASGAVVGLFSALLGVGGGVIAIPLLMYLVRLPVEEVAATSIGIIAITATAGTASYMLGGMDAAGTPAGSIGYVHLGAGAVMFVGAVLSVALGTRLNQRLNERALRLLFAAVFVLLGARLVIQNLLPMLAA